MPKVQPVQVRPEKLVFRYYNHEIIANSRKHSSQQINISSTISQENVIGESLKLFQ